MFKTLLAALLLGATPVLADQLPDGDAARGEALFQARCHLCHSLETNRVGPPLGGVVGRLAGSVVDFNYSPAVRGAGFVWTPALIAQWLTNPQALLPGQRMNFRVNLPADRADVIAFLKSRS